MSPGKPAGGCLYQFYSSLPELGSQQGSCSTGRMNKLWRTQATELYSALKRDELSGHEEMWRNLKGRY